MQNNDKLTNKKVQSWIIFGLAILNIVAFIVLSNKLYFRIDMTEGQKYSISKATKDLLKKLDNNLILEYYYNDKSKEVKEVAQVIQYVEDMLKEYENAGKGLVNVVIKELSYEKPKDQALIAEIEQKGIQQFALSESGSTESKSLLGFSGMLLTYKENQSVIPAIYNDQGFEFRLDVEIKKIVGGGDERLGIYFNAKDRTLEKDFRYLKQVTEREFKNIHRMYAGQSIPQDVTILLIVGGENLTDFDVFQIDQFLMNGGNALFAVNGINVLASEYGIYGIPGDSKVFELLAHYGVRINRDLVGDNQSYNPIRQGLSLARYPLWIKVKSANFNKKNVMVSEIERINLLWSSSVEILDYSKDKAQTLFSTTKGAWNQTENFKLDLETYKYPIQEGKKDYSLAAAFDGAINSFFKDKAVPKNENGEQFTGSKTDAGTTKFVVIGNEQFIQDNFAGNDEFIFLMNAIDWLSKDNSLIEIRNKGKFSKPLDKVKDVNVHNFLKSFIIGFTTYVIPIIFILIEVILFILRNSRNKKIHEFYNKDIKS